MKTKETLQKHEQSIQEICETVKNKFDEIEGDFRASGCKKNVNNGYVDYWVARNLGWELDEVKKTLSRLLEYLRIEQVTTPEQTIIQKRKK